MKKYTDVWKKPLESLEVTACARVSVQMKFGSTSLFTRRFGIGYGKALEILTLLIDANVVAEPSKEGRHRTILKSEEAAINAALRQLKKGKK